MSDHSVDTAQGKNLQPHSPVLRNNFVSFPLVQIQSETLIILVGKRSIPVCRKKVIPSCSKAIRNKFAIFLFFLPFVPFFLFFLHRVLFMALHPSFTFLLCCVCGKVFTLLYPCILRGRFCRYSTYLGLGHT